MTQVSLYDRYKSASEILTDLNYTSPQVSLANCLVVQQHPDRDRQIAQIGRNSHYSPATKEAIAIREWKERRYQKQQHNLGKTELCSLISSGLAKT